MARPRGKDIVGFRKADADSLLARHRGSQRGRRPTLDRRREPKPLATAWVKIPDDGFPAATNDGATPSRTECTFYTNSTDDGSLEVLKQPNGNDWVDDVLHYGAATDTAANHEFKYAQVHATLGGWVLGVEYCNS